MHFVGKKPKTVRFDSLAVGACFRRTYQTDNEIVFMKTKSFDLHGGIPLLNAISIGGMFYCLLPEDEAIEPVYGSFVEA